MTPLRSFFHLLRNLELISENRGVVIGGTSYGRIFTHDLLTKLSMCMSTDTFVERSVPRVRCQRACYTLRLASRTDTAFALPRRPARHHSDLSFSDRQTSGGGGIALQCPPPRIGGTHMESVSMRTVPAYGSGCLPVEASDGLNSTGIEREPTSELCSLNLRLVALQRTWFVVMRRLEML